MRLTSRPCPRRVRRRNAAGLGLLGALTCVLVLLAAPAAHAAGAIVEGWGPSDVLGLGGESTVAPTPLSVPEGAFAAAVGSTQQERYGDAFVLTPGGVFSAGTGFLGFDLGLGGEETNATFELIPGTADATAVAAGAEQTLILQSDGTVLRFGAGQPTPAPIAGLSDVTAIAAGGEFSLALEGNGSVWTVGGTPTQVIFPPATPKATAVAVGYGQGLALLEDGSVWAWGENEVGEVGNGQTGGPVAAPERVIAPPSAGAPRVTAIAAGWETSFALFSNGSFEAWGNNGSGQLGLGNGAENVDVPTAPSGSFPPLTQISANSLGGTTYAIATSYGGATGPVVSWGAETGSEAPQRVGRLQGVSWLGVGFSGEAEIAADTPVLLPAHTDVPFYSHAIGSFSAPEDVEVNSVGEPTIVSNAHITGPDAGDFEIVGYNTSGAAGDYEPFPLTLGDLHVYVRFSPLGLGERLATLVVEGEGETAEVQLAGYATEAPIDTPGATGATGSAGPAGGAGSVGATGPAGPAGKNGVVVFAAAGSKASVKPGRVATLRFAVGNGTTSRFPQTSLSVSSPKGLDLVGARSATVASLGSGDSRTVTLRLKVGAKAKRGLYKVKVTWKLGGRTVTRTVRLRVL
jgi:hypothetical protein